MCIRDSIKILQLKWPGVFKLNVKRANEVLMKWNSYSAAEPTKALDRAKDDQEKETSRSKEKITLSSLRECCQQQYPADARVVYTEKSTQKRQSIEKLENTMVAPSSSV